MVAGLVGKSRAAFGGRSLAANHECFRVIYLLAASLLREHI